MPGLTFSNAQFDKFGGRIRVFPRVCGSEHLTLPRIPLTKRNRCDSFLRMSFARELRRRARHVIGPLLGIMVASYFGYHAVEGNRGLLAWHRMTAEIANAEARLEAITKSRQ